MTVNGVAIATVLSNVVSSILLYRKLRKSDQYIHVEPQLLTIHWGSFRQIMRIGLPAGIQSAVFAISNIVIQSAINSLGTIVMAASSAALNIEIIAYYVMNSFSQACATFVGQNYGAGKKERIRTGIREGVILTILINIPLALMLLCIPEFLTSFMLNDASIISYTRDFLAVTGICLFPLGWLFVFRNGCQGMGHTFVPMLSGVLEVSLRVVMVKLLTPYLAFRGVALAEVSAWIGAWIMLMITYWIYQERTDSFR